MEVCVFCDDWCCRDCIAVAAVDRTESAETVTGTGAMLLELKIEIIILRLL